MDTTTERGAIIAALSAWINQRPGLDPRDYGPGPYYRAESRRITQQKNDALAMLGAVSWRNITAEDFARAFNSAFAGRLTWDGQRLRYCTGQYWSIEYRAAACAVLASALWAYWRADTEPGKSADCIRAKARQELGRGIASRWFN